MGKTALAIVISAFNRPKSLARLLKSIAEAEYLRSDINLVISIDGGGDVETIRLANEFVWDYGQKEIIVHEVNLGLKEHICSCGNLSEKFGSIVMLEDDLLVSPQFYHYAETAISVYLEESLIAGISLYAYQTAENNLFDFQPIEDGTDAYLMQIASSWGQIWTSDQWSEFRLWQEKGGLGVGQYPEYISHWSTNSWKKLFIQYLIDSGRYFVFPRVSLSTNFEDLGVHMFSGTLFQVPLVEGKKSWNFPIVSEAKVRYDAWFEPEQDTIKHFCPDLAAYDFLVDLQGTRTDSTRPMMLTSHPGFRPIKNYGLDMYPSVLNVVHQIQGKEIGLYKTEAVDFSKVKSRKTGLTFSVYIFVKQLEGLEQTLKSLSYQESSNFYVFMEVLANIDIETVQYLCQSILQEGVICEVVLKNDSLDKNQFLKRSDISIELSVGDVLVSDSFEKVNEIFNQFGNAAAIVGLPIGARSKDYRWNKEMFQNQWKCRARVKNMVGVFRKSDTLTEQVAFQSEFYHLLLDYQVLLCMESLVESNSLFDDKGERAKLLQLDTKSQYPMWRRLIIVVLKRFASQTTLYTFMTRLPDVIRFDKVHSTYYLNRS